MAWDSHLFSTAVSRDTLVDGKPLGEQTDLNDKYYVYASSRNGVLLGQIEQVWKQSGRTDALYLSKIYVVLSDQEIQRWLAAFTDLLTDIEAGPEIVLEATKSRYTPFTTIHAQGFEPLPAEIVYPSDAVIKDGYIYYYREDEIVGWIKNAVASHLPQPEGDDEGESLQFVFNFLKSQLALLQIALSEGLAFVHSEQNPV